MRQALLLSILALCLGFWGGKNWEAEKIRKRTASIRDNRIILYDKKSKTFLDIPVSETLLSFNGTFNISCFKNKTKN